MKREIKKYKNYKYMLCKDLSILYATIDNNHNLIEIKINCATYEDDWDGKYYLFVNNKFIKAYKYKNCLYNYVRINYDTILMF